MPQLKQLSCCIQWSDTGAPFQEHGTLYGDGVVETFIIVPNKPQGFSIRLTSRGFICEGLVMIVFIDGNYQCNRSRVNLLPPAKNRPTNRTEIDFLLRQREKSQGDGLYLGREWRFDNHNIVAETPAGFQESHFDDLGVIEVLILRCRARNREDADYEGFSSGEDSDVFGDRPLVEEQEGPPAASVPQASAVAGPPIEEDGGMGFMGLFDGANDPPGLPKHDGGHDVPPGRWIWHQSHPPFPGVPEPPQYHQPEGYRFRSQSYARPPGTPHPQPCYDRRSYSGQPEKKVHFDVQRPGEQQRQEIHRRSSQIHQPQPQRPVSRVRERWPSNGSQGYPTQSYGPQRIDPSSHSTQWYDAPEHQNRRQPSNPPQQNNPPYNWGYGNGAPQENNGGRDSYPERPNNYSQSQPPYNQGRHPGPQSEQRQSSAPGQNNQGSASTVNARPSPPNNTNQGTPGQNTAYQSQTIPPRNPSVQSQRPSHPEPVYSGTRLEHPQHAEPSNEMLNHPISSPYTPAFPHHPYSYPHPSQMPHGYHYPQVPYPGYWPVPVPQAYDPNNAQMYAGRPATVMIHPPYMNPSGSAEQISPTNMYGNNSSYPTPNGGESGQGGGQDTNGDGSDNQGWSNHPSNDANDSSWNNGNDNAENGTWDQDANHGDTDKTNDQTNVGDGDQNDNPNAGDNNQGNDGRNNNDTDGNTGNDNNGNENDGWGNGDSGNNNNNDGWDDKTNNNQPANDEWGDKANDTQAANSGDNWGATAADNNGGGGATVKSQSPTAEARILSNIPRDLYGPHGPYYAFRGLRIGEPRPDAEEEPRFDVPKSLAAARGSTKQVQPGPGYRYYKKRIVPEYIDTLDNPYARFVFKYRTKDQLLNEIGIEVDVEPTGDAEIQDLQNLDKQILIEMLMRAKSALGGRVPSPPPEVSASAQGSEVGVPVAIDAPKHTYLKYNLPPLRPNNVNSAKPSISAGQPEPQQTGTTPKNKNNSDWNSQGNNNAGGNWNDTGNDTAQQDDWGGNAGGNNWDGPSASAKSSLKSSKSSIQSAGSQRSHSRNASGSMQPKPIRRHGTNTAPFNVPRPPTPKNIAPQNDPAVNNWDQAAPAPANDW